MSHFILRIFYAILFVAVAILLNPSALAQSQGVSPSIYGIDWSPDGDHIAVGTNESILIYDSDLNLIAQINDLLTSFIIWSPDSSRVVYETASSEGGFIKIFDINTLTIVTEIPDISSPSSDVTSLDWNPQGTEIVHSNGQVTIWDVQTGNLVKSLESGLDRVVASAWSPNGQFIAAAAADNYNQIVIWDFSSGNVVKRLQGTEGYLTLAWTPDSQRVLGSTFGDIEIWDVVNEQVVGILDGEGFGILALDLQDKYVAAVNSIDAVPIITIWDLSTGDIVQTIDVGVNSDRALALSPDGKQLAYGGANGTLEIIDLKDFDIDDDEASEASEPDDDEDSEPDDDNDNDDKGDDNDEKS